MDPYAGSTDWVFQNWCIWENNHYDKFKIANKGGSEAVILYVSNKRLNNWTKVQYLHKPNPKFDESLFWYDVHGRTVSVHLEKDMFEVTFDTNADMERFKNQLDRAQDKNEMLKQYYQHATEIERTAAETYRNIEVEVAQLSARMSKNPSKSMDELSGALRERAKSAEPAAKRHRSDRGTDDFTRSHGGGADFARNSGKPDAPGTMCADVTNQPVHPTNGFAKSPRTKSRRRSDAERHATSERLSTTSASAKMSVSEDAAVPDHGARRGTQISLKRGPALPVAPPQRGPPTYNGNNAMKPVSQDVRRKDGRRQSMSPKRTVLGPGHSSYHTKALDEGLEEVDTTASGGRSTSTQMSRSNSPARFYHRSGSLRNMGNTCYLNASLQALRSITEFIECLEENPPSTHVPIYEETMSTIRKLNTTDAMDPIEPQELRDAVIAHKKHLEHFSSMEQQDAHEFFNELVDRLRDDTKAHVDVWATDEYFTFQINADLLCTSCDYYRTRKEEYRNLPLDFVRPTRKNVDSFNGAESVAVADSCNAAEADAVAELDDPDATQPIENEDEYLVDINGLWEKFFEPEVIEYKCEKCKGEECRMARVITHYPKVLSLHIKRFDLHFAVSAHQYTYTKICDPVEIPDTLQLEDNFYELRSVVCHEGGRPDAGHYFCWVRSAGCGSHWTLYNDTYIHTKEDFPEEIKRKAYLVFYVKRDTPPVTESP